MHSNPLLVEHLFACTQCGECCKGFGGTYVTKKDILAIACYLGVSSEALISKYCAPSGKRLVLSQRDDGYCIFWNRICTIHPLKPRMCRQWPFIDSLSVDIANWHIMADSCPGMRRDIDEETLRTCLRLINIQ